MSLPSAVPESAREIPGISDWFRDKQRHFDQVVAAVEDYAIFMMDRSGTILDWNKGAERIKGYTASEIVGSHFSRFYPEDALAAEIPRMELEVASREGQFTDEGWRQRKDGTSFWAGVTITAIHSEGGQIEGFLKITRDLTEQMMALQTLRESEERFRLLVESVRDYAIFMLDPEGHVMSWNTGAHRLKGYLPNEIIGRHFSIFYPPDALALHVPDALIREALAEGRAEAEGWRVRKDGTRFWGNVVLTALRGKGGELRGFAKITRDLTARREVEALQETDRRKNSFLATLSHELRNPLAPMLAGTEILLASPGNAAITTEVGAMLRRQVDQMTHLIDDLLDMSRITTGKIVLKKTRRPFAAILESALETVMPAIKRLRHELIVRSPADDLQVEADPHRISQVISNLLGNAAKYTPSGGVIVVETGIDTDSNLRVTITDNGKGIPKPLQGSIFGLFEQGNEAPGEGLGIGLTLAKTLVEMHGGTIRVFSEGEGRGSEFTLILPILSGGTAEPEAPVGKTERPPGKGRVLVADDGKNAADILCMFFQMEGLDTQVAYDGASAVKAAESFAPDLICMDIGMPKLDGLEAARLIRKKDSDVILVAISGWGTDDDRRRSMDAGFDHHLVKPVKPDELRTLLNQYSGKLGRP